VSNYETSEAKKIFDKYACHDMFGIDKNGLPVSYQPMGFADPAGIVDLIGAENWLIAHIWETEKRFAAARKLGAEKGVCLYNFIDIVDTTGFEWARAMTAIDAYADTAKLMDKYYPLRESKVALLNAPWIFQAAYKIAKVIMSEETQEAVCAYGEKKKEWMPDLLKLIDENQIPKQFGGTNENEWKLKLPPKIEKK